MSATTFLSPRPPQRTTKIIRSKSRHNFPWNSNDFHAIRFSHSPSIHFCVVITRRILGQSQTAPGEAEAKNGRTVGTERMEENRTILADTSMPAPCHGNASLRTAICMWPDTLNMTIESPVAIKTTAFPSVPAFFPFFLWQSNLAMIFWTLT